MTEIEQQYTTLSEIAKEHGIKYHALFMRLKSRKIPYVKIGHHTLIDRQHIDALIEDPNDSK